MIENIEINPAGLSEWNNMGTEAGFEDLMSTLVRGSLKKFDLIVGSPADWIAFTEERCLPGNRAAWVEKRLKVDDFMKKLGAIDGPGADKDEVWVYSDKAVVDKHIKTNPDSMMNFIHKLKFKIDGKLMPLTGEVVGMGLYDSEELLEISRLFSPTYHGLALPILELFVSGRAKLVSIEKLPLATAIESTNGYRLVMDKAELAGKDTGNLEDIFRYRVINNNQFEYWRFKNS